MKILLSITGNQNKSKPGFILFKRVFRLIKKYKRGYKLCKLRKKDIIPVVINRKNENI